MSKLLNGLSDILPKVVDNKTSIKNSLITLQIFWLERLSSQAIFCCPCYKDADIAEEVMTRRRQMYGLSFLVAPAIVLLMISWLINPTTARLCTGFTKRKPRFFVRCSTLIRITMQSVIAPLAWLSIALLDGKYLACVMTTRPYMQSCVEFYTTSRERPAVYSEEFQLNRAISQMIGWFVLSTVFLLGAVIYTWRRYYSSIFHWQKKYISLTKHIEREEFEKVSEEKIREDAKENLWKFLNENRSEKDWEKVTGLFRVRSDSGKISAFSSLQLWLNGDAEIKALSNDESNGLLHASSVV